jgi:ribosomal protein S18 acetylase RimI-like enzyme
MFKIREMTSDDLSAAVRLQALAFPPPFSEDLHWDRRHLQIHIDKFPEGQLVAVSADAVIGTCSNTIITEERWQAHENWYRTVGGPAINGFNYAGSTLYGLDITVHPEYRRMGVGRGFYEARYALVRRLGLRRYGTGCRMPDYI